MFVDNGGALWLSDPAVVLMVLAGVIGIVMWCHRWMETGTMPLPGNLNVGRVTRERTLREKLAARPAPRQVSRLDRSARLATRARRSGSPRQAA
ncbi:MAG: hypothetical protein IT306_14375 [Chloroflexi bacterium]|nr:hypothetical protein [Chloroflexota bacterium]